VAGKGKGRDTGKNVVLVVRVVEAAAVGDVGVSV
jgi:hypothetical protein